MNLCSECKNWDPVIGKCTGKPFMTARAVVECDRFTRPDVAPCDREEEKSNVPGAAMLFHAINAMPANDPVNSPGHYVGKIECIDYLRDKLTPAEFTGFCMGNVLKYCSRWRKKDGVQDLHKAMVYLKWAIENEENKP